MAESIHARLMTSSPATNAAHKSGTASQLRIELSWANQARRGSVPDSVRDAPAFLSRVFESLLSDGNYACVFEPASPQNAPWLWPYRVSTVEAAKTALDRLQEEQTHRIADLYPLLVWCQPSASSFHASDIIRSLADVDNGLELWHELVELGVIRFRIDAEVIHVACAESRFPLVLELVKDCLNKAGIAVMDC